MKNDSHEMKITDGNVYISHQTWQDAVSNRDGQSNLNTIITIARGVLESGKSFIIYDPVSLDVLRNVHQTGDLEDFLAEVLEQRKQAGLD